MGGDAPEASDSWGPVTPRRAQAREQSLGEPQQWAVGGQLASLPGREPGRGLCWLISCCCLALLTLSPLPCGPASGRACGPGLGLEARTECQQKSGFSQGFRISPASGNHPQQSPDPDTGRPACPGWDVGLC